MSCWLPPGHEAAPNNVWEEYVFWHYSASQPQPCGLPSCLSFPWWWRWSTQSQACCAFLPAPGPATFWESQNACNTSGRQHKSQHPALFRRAAIICSFEPQQQHILVHAVCCQTRICEYLWRIQLASCVACEAPVALSSRAELHGHTRVALTCQDHHGLGSSYAAPLDLQQNSRQASDARITTMILVRWFTGIRLAQLWNPWSLGFATVSRAMLHMQSFLFNNRRPSA